MTLSQVGINSSQEFFQLYYQIYINLYWAPNLTFFQCRLLFTAMLLIKKIFNVDQKITCVLKYSFYYKINLIKNAIAYFWLNNLTYLVELVMFNNSQKNIVD